MDLARISHANYHDANIDKQHFAKRKPMIQARNATIKRLTRNTSQQTVELLSANQASNYIELTSLEQKIRSTGAKSKQFTPVHMHTCTCGAFVFDVSFPPCPSETRNYLIH